MVRDGFGGAVVSKDGLSWEIGTEADVAWIAHGISIGVSVTAAIPPVFEAYATVVLPETADLRDEHEASVMRVLTQVTAAQGWWLGYLDTGADDIVFPDAPRARLYASWPYVLVKAGPVQARRWRSDAAFAMHCRLPDLMFPEDRSWLISALWDDSWWCVGGPSTVVDDLLREPGLETYAVTVDQDATPPGYVAR